MDILRIVLATPAVLLPALLAVGFFAAMVAVTPRRAQPPLPSRAMEVRSPDGSASVPLSVEIAVTSKEQRIGLMHRPFVPHGTGMLFRWSRPTRAAIWMRNVKVPLDLVFLAADGTVLSVVRRRPGGWSMSGGRTRSSGLLELPGGTCRRHGIVRGWSLRPVRGSRSGDPVAPSSAAVPVAAGTAPTPAAAR